MIELVKQVICVTCIGKYSISAILTKMLLALDVARIASIAANYGLVNDASTFFRDLNFSNIKRNYVQQFLTLLQLKDYFFQNFLNSKKEKKSMYASFSKL